MRLIFSNQQQVQYNDQAIQALSVSALLAFGEMQVRSNPQYKYEIWSTYIQWPSAGSGFSFLVSGGSKIFSCFGKTMISNTTPKHLLACFGSDFSVTGSSSKDSYNFIPFNAADLIIATENSNAIKGGRAYITHASTNISTSTSVTVSFLKQL